MKSQREKSDSRFHVLVYQLTTFLKYYYVNDKKVKTFPTSFPHFHWCSQQAQIGKIVQEQMCARLPGRLKSMFFEMFSSIYAGSFRISSVRKQILKDFEVNSNFPKFHFMRILKHFAVVEKLNAD